MTRTPTISDADAKAALFGPVAPVQPVTITLPGYRPKSWNTLYAGKHFRTRMQYVEEAHDAVKVALQEHPVTPFTVPVAITITAFYKGQMTDPDNVSAKLVIDGLRHAGVIVDDTATYITSVTCISRKDNQNPRVEIEITPEGL